MTTPRSSTKVLLLAAAVIAGCGGGSTAPAAEAGANGESQDAGATASSVTVTFSATGISPSTVRVARGGTVTFTNTDGAPHEPASNSHPTHMECPEFNVGSLAQNASATATAGNAAKTCGFHDHLNPSNTAFQGTVVIE